MTRRWRVAMVAAVALLAVGAGCGGRREPSDSVAGNAGTIAGTKPASRVEDVPVVYQPEAKYLKLSGEQKEKVMSVARGIAPKGKDVWFIYFWVFYDNKEEESAGRVTVYFAPEDGSKRLRRGEAVTLKLRELDEVAKGGDEETETFDYCQVAEPGESSKGELRAPDAPSLKPFAAPEGFTDEELVGIVGFVRSGPEDKEELEGGGERYGGRVQGRSPITSISRDEKGIIVVCTGTQLAPLAGAGQEIRIQKSGNGYRLVGLSNWIS